MRREGFCGITPIGSVCVDLKEFMPIQGRTFGVLGAGGAARAILFGILSEGGKPVVLNRTAAKGEALAKEFGCSFLPLSEIGVLKADCIVNTTSVGMAPQIENSPLEERALGKFPCVVDIIYNPLETKLLKDAEGWLQHEIGIGDVVHQEQIRLWTSMEPPVESMKRVVRKKLEEYEKN
jgi:shikimate 5-dehydrogenase